MRLMTTLGGMLAVTLLSGAALAAPAGGADSFGGDVNLLVGQKTLHDNDWNFGGGANLDNQLGAGIMANLGMRSWPVNIAADLFYSSGSNSGVSANTLLIGLGARKNFPIQTMPAIVPYAGVGFSYGSGSASANGTSYSGTGEGLWLDGGAQYKINKLGIGLDLRWASCPGKVSVAGQNVNVDLDGFLAALSVGYGF